MTVGEQQYSKDKLPEVFDQAGKKLEELVLGENTTLDEVRGDLNLIERIPDTGIEVSWELDNYEVMNLMGELNEDNLREEGTLVGLRALLSYEGEEAVHSFCAKVFPPAISAEEKRVRELLSVICIRTVLAHIVFILKHLLPTQ